MSADEIVQSAIEEDAAVIGLSVLSGSHLEVAAQVQEALQRQGAGESIPVVLGGIVPDDDVDALRGLGVRAVFTPKDFDLMAVMDRVLDVIGAPAAAAAPRAASA
jgi:(2R)-ethylmalonyl-CoA mutase